MSDPSSNISDGIPLLASASAVIGSIASGIIFYWRDKLSTRVGLAQVKSTADEAKKTSEENRQELKKVREQQIEDSTKLDMILERFTEHPPQT